jgi:hypothetical protein
MAWQPQLRHGCESNSELNRVRADGGTIWEVTVWRAGISDRMVPGLICAKLTAGGLQHPGIQY